VKEVKPEDVAGWVQIQAGHELARLVEAIRLRVDFRSAMLGGRAAEEIRSAALGGSEYLHSKHDAEALIWRWALKWAPSMAEAPQPAVPAPVESARKAGEHER
jgi:hypothetical protein